MKPLRLYQHRQLSWAKKKTIEEQLFLLRHFEGPAGVGDKPPHYLESVQFRIGSRG